MYRESTEPRGIHGVFVTFTASDDLELDVALSVLDKFEPRVTMERSINVVLNHYQDYDITVLVNHLSERIREKMNEVEYGYRPEVLGGFLNGIKGIAHDEKSSWKTGFDLAEENRKAIRTYLPLSILSDEDKEL